MNGHPTDLCPALNRPSSTTLDFPKTYSLSAANISQMSFPISAASLSKAFQHLSWLHILRPQ